MKKKKTYKERETRNSLRKKRKKRQKERDIVDVCGPALYFILETGVGGSRNVHHHISFKNKHFKIADPQKKTR